MANRIKNISKLINLLIFLIKLIKLLRKNIIKQKKQKIYNLGKKIIIKVMKFSSKIFNNSKIKITKITLAVQKQKVISIISKLKYIHSVKVYLEIACKANKHNKYKLIIKMNSNSNIKFLYNH
jgi:hypothetical protein